jgi:peptidoglycan/LPS O-acetylase OafA/YrhL
MPSRRSPEYQVPRRLPPCPSGPAGRRYGCAAGLVSYGMYLYHYSLTRQIHAGGASTVRLLVLAAFGIVAAGAAGAMSYCALERSALKLKRVAGSSRLGRLLSVEPSHGA